ncbi:MAG: hypothetical protein KDA44_07695 [Planctomycetales bacterium]|nr:hypothetical protein [Planctomycetales bacterium]
MLSILARKSLFAFALAVACVRPACAATIELASATLASPGQFAGQSISTNQFLGWRFAVTTGIRVTEVGGHMLRATDGGVFAAIIRLDALDALPQGAPFEDAEVLATAAFEPPTPSDDAFTPISAVLTPGNYAVVFGAGLYDGGTTKTGTNAAMVQGQPLIGETTQSSFIAWFGNDLEWRAGIASNMRFVIRGSEFAGAGDFELDGDIDSDDLAIWQHSFGMSGAAQFTDGDANEDGVVNGGDLLEWQRSLTAAADTATTAVPEPAGMVLAAAWGLALVVARHATAKRAGLRTTPARNPRSAC